VPAAAADTMIVACGAACYLMAAVFTAGPCRLLASYAPESRQLVECCPQSLLQLLTLCHRS